MPSTIRKEQSVSGVSLEELERYKADLRAELGRLGAQDAQEKEELKGRIAELEGYIGEQKKAQAERDKVADNKTTMVVPPASLAPTQPVPTPTQGPSGPNGEVKKESFLKRWW